MIEKYLQQYAEPEVILIDNLPAELRYHHVVVIPAYKESAAFLKQFNESCLLEQGFLLILVVNQPETEEESRLQLALQTEVLESGSLLWQNQNLALVQLADSPSAILVVDRFTKSIPAKQGVGLARKIGADLACQLMQQQVVLSQWIHSTDADATLPADYFSAIKSCNEDVAIATYNFSHQCEDEKIYQANALYEQAMRYYVAGLTYANSSYNFYTIGSLLAFKAQHYAQVRGFPKRSAGEDFYLINKLSKLGKVLFIEHSTVILKARLSNRVPFGTGPAVEKIITNAEQGLGYYYYHPAIFDDLKNVLANLDTLFELRFSLNTWFEKLSTNSKHALLSIGLTKFVEQHLNAKKIQFEKQFIVWFDAFKTLKFIHHIRDNGVESILLSSALEQACFMQSSEN
ncbi:hypothetical protein Q4489_07735 [Thalassotalea sp. 1_MG-2023]|uniref:hypothetical protein n=1 Tax=Thalassotalea sp. 1_MG-2023 TaxID=3062680 RepID=UPI0026E32BD7|nr:hypothetical protein [Thalassotalea sp. 1_MG-2023]MDO6426895.1 hypothetical protein [Thalassotalea sp. 1_MG-2023]